MPTAGDLLRELARLAAGGAAEPEASTRSIPRESPPLPVRAPRAEPVPARPDHEVHRAHAQYGTDPSERAPSEQDGLDPLAETLSEDARAVREQLMSHNTSSLRQAIILREVLGPPISMRD